MNFNKNTQICEKYLVNSKKYSTFAAKSKLYDEKVNFLAQKYK